jgi:hypothetical protein
VWHLVGLGPGGHAGLVRQGLQVLGCNHMHKEEAMLFFATAPTAASAKGHVSRWSSVDLASAHCWCEKVADHLSVPDCLGVV